MLVIRALRSSARSIALNKRYASSVLASIHLIDPSSTDQAPSSAQKLWSSVPTTDGPSPKPAQAGTTRLFFEPDRVVALSSLGGKFSEKRSTERREVVRKAVGSAVKSLKGLGNGAVGTVEVNASQDPHASAVAATLAKYKFTLQTSKSSAFHPDTRPPAEKPPVSANELEFNPVFEESKPTREEWDRGVVYAEAQNFARTLAELPGNMLTPTIFAERIQQTFDGVENVTVYVRDEEWIEGKGMRTFLSVAKGSSEPPRLVEIHYNGASKDEKPIVLVGKGVTFDSGGISIKPSSGMKDMRGDMGGAASVCATALAIARLKLPVNLVVVTPLTENMPGPNACKPGDIIYAMNGKTIEIDNTDAEGRLILADALYYAATTFKPHTMVDVATLTGAIVIALGEVFSGVFTTSDTLWEELRAAGDIEHDRFWRQPLDEEYMHLITSSNADLCNSGGRPAGSTTAALFLKEFVDGLEAEGGKEPAVRWAHLDIAGTMEATRGGAYQEKGMTGRPTRALIEFVRGNAGKSH